MGPRPSNEDWLHWDVDLGLFVVADGMGGHNAGEVAAHLAIETVAAFIKQSQQPADLTWPFGLDLDQSFAANRLSTAVRLANQRVHREGLAHEAFRGMGTTIVALLVSGESAVMTSVGDSRVYRWRGAALELLTRDDTWLSALKESDARESDGMRSNPMCHVLTRVIGPQEDLTLTMKEDAVQAGDCWLLCTDGVHEHADAPWFARLLHGRPQVDQLAIALVDHALAGGAEDNATALVICID